MNPFCAELTPALVDQLQMKPPKRLFDEASFFRSPLYRPDKISDTARPKEMSDPFKDVDWKSYARTGQFYVRKSPFYKKKKVVYYGIIDTLSLDFPTLDGFDYVMAQDPILKDRSLMATKRDVLTRVLLFVMRFELQVSEKIILLFLDRDLQSVKSCQFKNVGEILHCFERWTTEKNWTCFDPFRTESSQPKEQAIFLFSDFFLKEEILAELNKRRFQQWFQVLHSFEKKELDWLQKQKFCYYGKSENVVPCQKKDVLDWFSHFREHCLNQRIMSIFENSRLSELTAGMSS